MARKAQRREQPPGELTNAQVLHLLVGNERYRWKGFRLPKAPFRSEAERRQAWENNKDLIRSYCQKPIPDEVRRELLIPDRIEVWTISAVPHAKREYGTTGQTAVDHNRPAGRQTPTPALTPAGADVPMPMTTPDPAAVPDGCSRRP